MARRRKKKKGESSKIDPPMAAMIDIVFLLLIYFIATFKENKVEAHLAINMPSPSKTRAEDKPPTLFEVYILPDKYLLMGTREMTIDKLEEKLIALASFDAEQTVMIKMSPSAVEEQLVSLLDRCGKAGLTQLNVLTLKE
jgi:biopolymer transport protein ExbD